MVRIIGVRFKSVGKIYYFAPGEFDIKVGDSVIVETARGMELGKVVIGIREVNEESVVMPLKEVTRMATDEDIHISEANRIKEKQAFAICKERIEKHELAMKLVEVEYTFDGSKILFYYTADERVDFRELVKDLAAVFKTRIEMRCIGVRDGTKALGGIGMCGRVLCCHSYLDSFIPVSIKMAKEQNLPLNPTKISGVCGRLMCCLKNESETYEWLNSKCPNVGDMVTTSDGFKGEVSSVNVLRQLVKVKIFVDKDEKEIKEYHVDDLKFTRGKRYVPEQSEPEDLKALEALEDKAADVPAAKPGRHQKEYNKENSKSHENKRSDDIKGKDRPKKSFNQDKKGKSYPHKPYPQNKENHRKDG